MRRLIAETSPKTAMSYTSPTSAEINVIALLQHKCLDREKLMELESFLAEKTGGVPQQQVGMHQILGFDVLRVLTK